MAASPANLPFEQFVPAVEQTIAALRAAGVYIDFALYPTPEAIASECDGHAVRLVAQRATVSTLDEACQVIAARIREPQTTKRQVRKLKPIYRSLARLQELHTTYSTVWRTKQDLHGIPKTTPQFKGHLPGEGLSYDLLRGS